MKKVRFIAAVALGIALTASALADTLVFMGRDGDWLNPGNWSGGHVPGRGDSVLVLPFQHLLVDPNPTTGYEVVMEDILITSFSSVETRPGTKWSTRNEIVFGSLIHRGTDASLDLGGVGFYAGSGSSGGVWLNPTPKSKRIIVLQSSLTVGLGGTQPASAGHVGRGFYATLSGENITIGGSLDVVMKYGFVPQDGDVFHIVSAPNLVGRFAGLREGALVKRIGDIGLYIHYTAREHILLARQIGH